MTDGIHPVILCGGSGTRLWPRSRADRPKPFLRLLGEQSLFEATLARCRDAARFAPPMVVTGARHVGLVEAQGHPGMRIVVEPDGRNTAPAIALAAALLPEDAVMLVCPSDHHIADVDAFRAAVDQAGALAGRGRLVAFGIAPDRAETGYGYIQRGAAIDGGYDVARFVEKPSEALARDFVASGEFSWNGGIFAFRAGTLLEELARHRPAMAQAVREAVAGGSDNGPRFHPSASFFAGIEGESIDYAVMENTDRAALVPVDMGWSDIGNWTALREAREGDEGGNVVRGAAELVDCRNVMVDSDGPRVSCIGLEDVIVVVDGDEVLVMRAEDAQKVGKLGGASG
ncbi:mannose-1-phosphate guanylyltransferase [Pelagerythrobacter rhizovicinus]|uniref:Mannose-1-phosphate guanylyltransferase n=1 Tax=Pelagerythrobacter rhizovicinus TaxID=2268576 RepID=A0A4Q2KM27_9SPHN|nr:mannose-1-phosphate guanylyltransferase [Pelagerythrobacter rhizovicinus]RXZ64211.1 mannose-1-phosphate guanylyltransferase [Pelagerythrobacter rhizovicinus]